MQASNIYSNLVLLRNQAMQIDENWYLGLPKRRLLLYDKIYLLAILNFRKGRYRYFDDFYTGLKESFKIHPSELENQLSRYQAL